jgi:hypothetical protein
MALSRQIHLPAHKDKWIIENEAAFDVHRPAGGKQAWIASPLFFITIISVIIFTFSPADSRETLVTPQMWVSRASIYLNNHSRSAIM